MKLILKLIFKEIKSHPKFALLFILNTSLGLCGFMALNIFKNSMNQTLHQHSQAMLGADMILSARRPIKPEERQIVFQRAGSSIKESQITQTYSMVSNPKGRSRLVQIKAIEENFPFYGSFDLVHQGKHSVSANTDLHKENNIWVYPEILLQLDIQVGEFLLIGNQPFKVSDIVEQDPSSSFTSNLAPRVYISQNHLKSTGLIQRGSLAWHSYVYHIPHQPLALLKQQISSQIKEPQVRIHTHKDSSELTSRLLSYLSDFLSLTSLCSLFLACIGLSFLFRSYFREKTYSIALLLSLGMPKFKTVSLYLLEILFLGGLSFITAAVLAGGLLPFLESITNYFIPIKIQIQWSLLASSFLLSAFISLGAGLPLILQLRKIKPASILHPQSELKISFQQFLLFILLGFIGLWILAIWQSSFRLGSFFTAIFTTSCLFLFGIAWFFIKILNRPWFLNKISLWPLRWAIRDLVRQNRSTLSCFLSLSLGIVLLNLLPQIQKSLSTHIQAPSRQPSLFLFDIQEHQTPKLKELLEKHKTPLDKLTPLIQARLLSINGQPFRQRKKNPSQAEKRMHNRGFNLTYRTRLYESESIIKGKNFLTELTPPFSIPRISVETRFAKRLGLHIKDILIFDIEGRKVTGQIQNIRRVNWLSFDPNFFIVFEPKTLDSFFKTFLATLSRLTPQKKNHIQNIIVSAFPNISMIDVSKLTQKFLFLSQQASLALLFMILGILAIGCLVFYSICSFQIEIRKKDILLLKQVGIPLKKIKNLFLYQFVLLAFSASVFGVFISTALSYIVSLVFFDSLWTFNLWPPILLSIGIPIFAFFLVNQACKHTYIHNK